MYWTCTAGTSYMIRAVSERTPPGGRGAAVGEGEGMPCFFLSFQANSFLFTFFFERRSQRPGPFMEITWPRDLFLGYGEHGRGGKYVHVMYTLEYKITILLGDGFLSSFFEPIKLSDDERMPRQKKHVVCVFRAIDRKVRHHKQISEKT